MTNIFDIQTFKKITEAFTQKGKEKGKNYYYSRYYITIAT